MSLKKRRYKRSSREGLRENVIDCDIPTESHIGLSQSGQSKLYCASRLIVVLLLKQINEAVNRVRNSQVSDIPPFFEISALNVILF